MRSSSTHGSADRNEGFEQIFRANFHAVRRFAERQYPTLDRDDLVSRTFEIAWKKYDDAPAEAMRGWLIGITRNLARNDVRGRRRFTAFLDRWAPTSLARESSLHDERVPAETAELLVAALSKLQPDDRLVIELAAIDGLDNAELGAALGISARTAAVRLHRARQRLDSFYGGGGR